MKRISLLLFLVLLFSILAPKCRADSYTYYPDGDGYCGWYKSNGCVVVLACSDPASCWGCVNCGSEPDNEGSFDSATVTTTHMRFTTSDTWYPPIAQRDSIVVHIFARANSGTGNFKLQCGYQDAELGWQPFDTVDVNSASWTEYLGVRAGQGNPITVTYGVKTIVKGKTAVSVAVTYFYWVSWYTVPSGNKNKERRLRLLQESGE